MRILHLTHNDADAVGCDVLLKLIYHLSYPNRKDVDIVSLFCSNKNIDEVANFTLDNSEEKFDLIYVTDNCVTSETAKRLEESCNEIHLYDHHPTNKLNEEFDWAIVQARENPEDAESRMISAAEVLYNEINFDGMYDFRNEDNIFPYHFLHTFMMDVSRYDTWEWKRHNKYIGLIPDLDPDDFSWFMDKNNYDILMPEPRNKDNSYTFDPYYEDIIAVVTGKLGASTASDLLVTTFMSYFKLAKDDSNSLMNALSCGLDNLKYSASFYGHLIRTIYLTEKINEKKTVSYAYNKKVRIARYVYNDMVLKAAMLFAGGPAEIPVADYVLRKHKDIDITITIFIEENKISFRTLRDDIDLGQLCKTRYNGGGHPQAAGGYLKEKWVAGYLKQYYASKLLVEEYENEG